MIEQRAVAQEIGHDAEVRRLGADTHEQDDVRVPEGVEHLNLITQIGDQVWSNVGVEHLLDSDLGASEVALMHNTKATYQH